MITDRFRWLLVGGVLVLLGCSLFSSEPEKITVDSKYDRAFDRVRSVISSYFSIESASREKGKIKTKWKVSPSDVKSKRKRLFARVEEPEDKPNVLRITLRSEVQAVESGLKSYRTEKAEWNDAGRDRKLEKDLLEMIRFDLKLSSDELEHEILQEMEEREEREKRLEELKQENQRSE